MLLREPPQLRPAHDERLAGLERGYRRRPLLARQQRELSERVARPADGERDDVPERRADAHVEATLRDQVNGVGRVAAMEHDLAAAKGAATGEREHRTDVRGGDAVEQLPIHV